MDIHSNKQDFENILNNFPVVTSEVRHLSVEDVTDLAIRAVELKAEYESWLQRDIEELISENENLKELLNMETYP